MTHMMEESFRKYADRNAYVCMDRFLTSASSTACRSRWRLAAGRAWQGAGGDHAAQRLQYPVAMAAILHAGYTVVNVARCARRASCQLGDSGAEAIIVLENFAVVQQVLAASRSSTWWWPPWATCWAASRACW